jgi:Skp family chaperone for outer membrane proteins
MTDFARLHFSLLLVWVMGSFFACNSPAEPASSAPPPAPVAANGLSVVFIKADSLQTGYTAVADELSRLEDNFRQAQENHNGRVQALENEVRGLQNQVQQGLLAPNKVQAEQQRIARKEQEIMQQRDLAINSIQSEQMQIQQRFGERVKAVLEELREENGYDFILSQGQGSSVLITNDAYDITPLVLERLNAAAPVDTPQ